MKINAPIVIILILIIVFVVTEIKVELTGKAVVDTSNIEETSYVYGNGLIASIDKEGLKYYHNDFLGSPSVITDSSGNKVSEQRYDVFGSSLLPEISRLEFTGKELDDDTNLHYFNARYYDSSVGKFTTPDTVKGKLSNPQSLNLYTYTLNNPLKYVDPSGNQEKPKLVLNHKSDFTMTGKNTATITFEMIVRPYVREPTRSIRISSVQRLIDEFFDEFINLQPDSLFLKSGQLIDEFNRRLFGENRGELQYELHGKLSDLDPSKYPKFREDNGRKYVLYEVVQSLQSLKTSDNPENDFKGRIFTVFTNTGEQIPLKDYLNEKKVVDTIKGNLLDVKHISMITNAIKFKSTEKADSTNVAQGYVSVGENLFYLPVESATQVVRNLLSQ